MINFFKASNPVSACEGYVMLSFEYDIRDMLSSKDRGAKPDYYKWSEFEISAWNFKRFWEVLRKYEFVISKDCKQLLLPYKGVETCSLCSNEYLVESVSHEKTLRLMKDQSLMSMLKHLFSKRATVIVNGSMYC